MVHPGANGAAELTDLALSVLATPSPALDAILRQLFLRDKLSLAATCTTLRQASLAWFPEVTVTMAPCSAALVSLAEWLVRYKAKAHLTLRLFDPESGGSSSYAWCPAEELARQLAVLPRALVVSFVAATGASFDAEFLYESDEVPLEAAAEFSCLQRLHLPVQPGLAVVGDVSRLWRLAGLRHLALDCLWCVQESWAGLAQLQQLEHLELWGVQCARAGSGKGVIRMPGLPAAVSQLTALTHLQLEAPRQPTSDDYLIRPHHLQPLTRLRSLCLRNMSQEGEIEQWALQRPTALTAFTCR